MEKNTKRSFKFTPHILSPRIIHEHKIEQTSMELNVDNNNSSGFYILHNHICDLFGKNVYIVKYLNTIENITLQRHTSLIPLYPTEIIYIFFCNDPNLIKHIHSSLELYLYHKFYYDCPLVRLVRIITECIKIHTT